MAWFHRIVLINVSAVACLAAAAAYGFAVSGSGDDDTVAVPVPDPVAAGYCRALHDALPQEVDGLPRHDLKPASDLTAGWGSPSIKLRCGVPRPEIDNDDDADGIGVDGVSWSVEEGPGGGLLLITTLRSVYVEVTLPKQYAAGLTALSDLAGPVKRTIPDL